MADAVVLTPQQIKQILAQSTSSASPNLSQLNPTAATPNPSRKSKLKTKYLLGDSHQPFYSGGSGTGNSVALLPLASPSSSSLSPTSSKKDKNNGKSSAAGKQPTLLLTTLDAQLLLTSPSTGQIVARIDANTGRLLPITPGVSDGIGEVDYTIEDDGGDQLSALTLHDIQHTRTTVDHPSTSDQAGSFDLLDQEQQGESKVDVYQTSTTALVATQALFLRFLQLTVTYVVARRSSADGDGYDEEDGDAVRDQEQAQKEPLKVHVDVRLVRSIPRAHDSAIVVLSSSSSRSSASNQNQAVAGEAAIGLIATGSSDGMVKIWDVMGGFCTYVLKGHGGVVSALEWDVYLPVTVSGRTAQGETTTRGLRRARIFTGSVDGRVRYWDLLSSSSSSSSKPSSSSAGGGIQQKPLQILQSHTSVVRGLAVSDDGVRLVSGSRDRTVAFWTLHRQLEEKSAWKLDVSVTANEGVECLGFLPSFVVRPSAIATGEREDLGTPSRRKSTKQSTAAAAEEGDKASNQQDLFYMAGSSGVVRIWSHSLAQIVAVQPAESGNSANVKPPGGAGGGEEEEDETRAIQEMHMLVSPAHPSISTSTSMLPHVMLLAVHADQTFAFRSVPNVLVTATASSEVPLKLVKQMVGFNDQVTDVVLLSPISSAEEETHLAIATNSHALHVYSFSASAEHNVGILRGHTGLVLCLDASCDRRVIASGSKDRTCRIWAPVHRNSPAPSREDVEWRCVATAQGHAESVGAVAFARRSNLPTEGKAAGACASPFLVTTSSDRTVKIWDLSTLPESSEASASSTPTRLRSLVTLKVHEKDINSVDVSPNNALLLTGSQDRTAKVFALNYAPPSKANGGAASATLQLLSTCKGHKRGVWCVRFSPADRAFATAGGDKTIKLWSLQDFACVRTFEGHTSSVLRVDFLNAGMQLLSSGADGLVKLWNVKDEICAWTGDAHEEQVWSLAVTKDDQRAITVGADSMIRIWEDCTVEEQAQKQQQKVEEVEQEQKFSNYLLDKDYRNAIHLALAMNHPRRLLHLFGTVSAQRPGGDVTSSVHSLLSSALAPGAGKGGLDVEDALRRAGILTPAHAPNETAEQRRDRESITGLACVDEIIATLPHLQLVQLLHHVRDWNTSTRTSDVAQTVLHAVLRLHTMDNILDAFDQVQGKGIAGAVAQVGKGGLKLHKDKFTKYVDAATLFSSLAPYTERHYNRAERLLIETAMLDFTLSSMDALGGESESGGDAEGMEAVAMTSDGERSDAQSDSDSEMEDM